MSQWQMFNWQRGVVRGKKGGVHSGYCPYKGETGTGFGSLVGTGSYITPDFAFPYGANFAEVAVNTPYVNPLG
ncbi:hypothetical protein ACVXHB_10180 [Escherichia coli]